MENLEIEIYKSLLEPKLLMGTPRSVAIYTALAFGAVLAVTENLIVILVYVIVCFIEAAISKKDPLFILIYLNKIDRSTYFGS